MGIVNSLREVLGLKFLEAENTRLRTELIDARDREREAVNRYLMLENKAPVLTLADAEKQAEKSTAVVRTTMSMFNDEETGSPGD